MNAKNLAKTIRSLEIYTNRKVSDVFSGNYKSSFKGQGLEVSDLREYEEGDDARYIDWIITAKQGRPYVRKFQETRELTTMILVDVSASMKFTTTEKTKSKVALETAACLLFSAMKNNDKFGVVIFSDKIHSYIPPQKGRNHFLRILREIIKGFEMGGNKATELNIALNFLNKTVKKRSICFLLSDDISELELSGKSALQSLKITNQRHDFIYIKIFDQFEKEITKEYPMILANNPETGEEEVINLSDKKLIKRYNKLRKTKAEAEKKIARNSRIDLLEISTTSNIYEGLLVFFKKRSLRHF